MRSSLVVLAGALLMAVACLDRPPGPLVDQAFADSVATAPRLDSALLAAAPAYRVLRLPDSVTRWSLSRPTSLSALGYACRLAVGDGIDNAVHVFGPAFGYAGTIYLGGRRRQNFHELSAVVYGAAGALVVSDFGTSHVAVVDSTLASPRIFDPVPTDSLVATLSRFAVVRDTLLVEDWLGSRLSTSAARWPLGPLPLLRFWDFRGHPLGTFGRVARRPGARLTDALNHGLVAAEGDTVWYAYAVSGQILRGVIAAAPRGMTLVDTSRLVLPRLYAPEPPREFYPASASAVSQVNAQITGFAVLPNGPLVVGQTISYPPHGRGLYRPTSAVVLYDRAGRFRYGWRVDGEVAALAAGGGVVAALVLDVGHEALETRIYGLPPTMAAGETECHWTPN